MRGQLSPYSKAIGAGLGALAGAVGLATADGVVTGWELVGVVGTVAAAVAAAYAAPRNTERPARRRRRQRREA